MRMQHALSGAAAEGPRLAQRRVALLTREVFSMWKDALRRAVAENPSLAEQYPELAAHVAKNEAEEEKDKGNKAFAAKR